MAETSNNQNTLSMPVTTPVVWEDKPIIPDRYKARVENLFMLFPVEADHQKFLMNRFSDYFEQLAKVEDDARGIEVKGIEDKEAMAKARDKRLFLKNIRTKTDKVRKKAKDGALNYGRLVDGMAKLIMEPCAEIEADLQEKEDFAKNQIKAAQEAVRKERAEKLAPYVADTGIFDLVAMSEEQFLDLLHGQMAAHDARLAREAEEEANRQAAIERAKKQTERANVLSAAGLSFAGDGYVFYTTEADAHDAVYVSRDDIENKTDDEFDVIVGAALETVSAIKTRREEKARAKAKLSDRMGTLYRLNMRIAEDGSFVYEAPEINEPFRITPSELELSDEAFNELTNQLQAITDQVATARRIAAAERQAETDRLKAIEAEAEAEKARKYAEALALRRGDDATKMLAVIVKIEDLVAMLPDVGEPYDIVVKRLRHDLKQAVADIKAL